MNIIAQDISTMKLLTTSQRLYTLRRKYSDIEIINALDYCERGIREALSDLLAKRHTDTTYIEREETPDKDIIEEMRGE